MSTPSKFRIPVSLYSCLEARTSRRWVRAPKLAAYFRHCQLVTESLLSPPSPGSQQLHSRWDDKRSFNLWPDNLWHYLQLQAEHYLCCEAGWDSWKACGSPAEHVCKIKCQCQLSKLLDVWVQKRISLSHLGRFTTTSACCLDLSRTDGGSNILELGTNSVFKFWREYLFT